MRTLKVLLPDDKVVGTLVEHDDLRVIGTDDGGMDILLTMTVLKPGAPDTRLHPGDRGYLDALAAEYRSGFYRAVIT